MASITQTFTKPFSRLKNGLIELQAFYPAYVKGGAGGLSVDPILYRSNFGRRTIGEEGGSTDLSNTAGIRVEAIGDGGETLDHARQTTITNYINPNNSEPRTIYVTSNSGFDTSGSFTINGITVTYTSIAADGLSFGGCQGINSTNAPSGINPPSQVRQGSGGTYTIEISGSGTHSPKCKITYANLVFDFYLIAPSADQHYSSSRPQYDGIYGSSTYGLNRNSYAGSALHPTDHNGPYPVFMTVQELAEMIDTYRHVGGQDETKRSFLPHGMGESSSAGTKKLALLKGTGIALADTRTTDSTDIMRSGKSGQAGSSHHAQGLGLRATVFMPMMLDNNQMGKRLDSNISFSYPFMPKLDLTNFVGYKDYGYERFNHDPTISKANGFFKTVGWSGDHLQGAVGAWSEYVEHINYYSTSDAYTTGGSLGENMGTCNPDASLDSTAAIGPKYRMRMALACFLKDGTYTINDGGDLIPYIYDPDRAIGGKNTSTLYAVWNGKQGYGEIGDDGSTHMDDCSAQIFPMFDFVQGPICPAKQGNNFDAEVVEGLHSIWGWAKGQQSNGATQTPATNPRSTMVRPNPMRSEIRYVQKSTTGLISIFTKSANGGGRTVSGSFGMPIYITGVTGQFGTGGTYADTKFDARNTSGWQTGKANNLDHNGWWISRGTNGQSYGDLGAGNEWTQITFVQTQNGLDESAGITGSFNRVEQAATTAYLCQGRPSGYEGHSADAYGANMFNLANQAGRKWVFPLGNGGYAGFSTGFTAGVCQPDSNVPAGGSEDSTYPARPTIFDWNTTNDQGKYGTSTKPTKRAIGIRKGGDDEFLTSPTVSVQGDGVLRIPPPIGWDLARVYYSQSKYTLQTDEDTPDWKKESGDSGQVGMNSRWALRGIHIPFWSAIDGITGNHAWDYVKPDNYKSTTYIDNAAGFPYPTDLPTTYDSKWHFGRNRIWPPHERVGTRAAYSPSLLENVANNSGATGVVPANGGWSVTASGNYLASNTESTKYGPTEMGCSPIWLDMEMRANIPIKKDRLVILEFDNGIQWGPAGRHAMITSGGSRNFQFGAGFYPVWDGEGTVIHPNTSSGTQLFGSDSTNMRIPTYTANRPAVWFWGGSEFFTAAWTNTDADVFPRTALSGGANNGWGSMGNGYGFGTPQSVAEGYQTIRTVFNEGGMTYILNGREIGTDPTAGSQIWGMTIKVGDAFGFLLNGEVNNSAGDPVYSTKPSFQMSQQDLQIDELILRQIPTPAMMPYKVDTTTQKIGDVGAYNTLSVEADNVDKNKGMNITVSIMQPNTKINKWFSDDYPASYYEYVGIEQAPATVVTDTDGNLMENLDLDFVAGMGQLDLSKVPASAKTSGIVIRFNFYIPDSTQTAHHPIDWNAIPTITRWTLDYTTKPTVTTTVTGNTDSGGDVTPPISTTVGNVVSFRATCATTDPNRKITQVKFDFGDGISTGFMDLADKTTQSQTFDVAHVYTKASAIGAATTFSMTATSRDDAGNESDASTAIEITVAESKPIAVLRASPSLIRANSAITFDGSSSYVVSSNSSRVINQYRFDAGDGSAVVNQASSQYTHTYTSAGEYEASLIVRQNDTALTLSDEAKVIVKVLVSSATATDLLGNLNTRPNSFTQARTANLAATPTLDGTFPEVTDTGQRNNQFTLRGSFLKGTATTDILQMETYLSNGTLLYIEWETTDYSGGSSVQRFTGRMVAFDYEREGGAHGETPYTAQFIREE